jgi:hypothetical protein
VSKGLGRVDKPDPDANCSEKDESGEALDEFLVTRGDAAQNGKTCRINPLHAVRCTLRVALPSLVEAIAQKHNLFPFRAILGVLPLD